MSQMKAARATNPTSSVDGGIPVQSNFGRPCPAATAQRR